LGGIAWHSAWLFAIQISYGCLILTLNLPLTVRMMYLLPFTLPCQCSNTKGQREPRHGIVRLYVRMVASGRADVWVCEKEKSVDRYIEQRTLSCASRLVCGLFATLICERRGGGGGE
jgi:hypothetical protein